MVFIMNFAHHGGAENTEICKCLLRVIRASVVFFAPSEIQFLRQILGQQIFVERPQLGQIRRGIRLRRLEGLSRGASQMALENPVDDVGVVERPQHRAEFIGVFPGVKTVEHGMQLGIGPGFVFEQRNQRVVHGNGIP